MYGARAGTFPSSALPIVPEPVLLVRSRLAADALQPVQYEPQAEVEVRVGVVTRLQYLVTYVFYGIALGVLAFALYDRLQPAAPATMRAATALGLLWSVALVASGMVFKYGMTTIVSLAKTDPARAGIVWQSIEPVAQALGGAGGEILGGLWVLLVSAVALRGRALPAPLGWYGVAIGVAGIASVVPPLQEAAMLFGLMLIVWFAWVGAVLARTKSPSAEAERTPVAASAALVRG